jgi:cell wall-associated NlpC family hydrolase
MDAAKRAQVVQEALTWLGTPYHHHARVKGVGVDCAQLLCAVYEACGCVPHIDPGNYAHDWHLHRGEEVFIGWLEKAGAREVHSHGGVVVYGSGAGTVVHAYLGRGVVRSRLDEEPLQGRAARFWSMRTARNCLLCRADGG